MPQRVAVGARDVSKLSFDDLCEIQGIFIDLQQYNETAQFPRSVMANVLKNG